MQDQKSLSLCIAVRTCATLVVPKSKFDSYILTPCNLKSRSNPKLLCIHVRCTHNANLVTTRPQVPEILHISTFVTVGGGGVAEMAMVAAHRSDDW